MDSLNIFESTTHLNLLKKDAQRTQKKGLPFIMASVVIWTMILVIQFLDESVMSKNLYTFMSSCALMPLAQLFSKVVKADIFVKNNNPINKLGLLCTMNQMLYLLIVMWAFNQKPEAMVMLYAMVFASHLLPYSWVYDSKAYLTFSVIETIGALILNVVKGNVPMIAFVILMEIGLCLCLFIEIRKEQK